jgi:hypothetical protein
MYLCEFNVYDFLLMKIIYLAILFDVFSLLNAYQFFKLKLFIYLIILLDAFMQIQSL